jgi:hypothetical protein
MVILDGFYSDDDYVKCVTRQSDPNRYMLAHSRGVEYSRSLDGLNFSVVDPFRMWSVFADFGHHQACIAQVLPLFVNVPDTSYVIGVDKQDVGYVDGAAFVPGVIRAQLTDFAYQGEYDVYSWSLPCVTARPAEALTSSDAGAAPRKSTNH